MKGVFSIAEAVASCQNRSKSTLFIFTNFDGEFDDSERKSLNAVGNLIVKLGGLYHTGINMIEELALSVSSVVNNYKQPLSFEAQSLIMGREEEINNEATNYGYFVAAGCPERVYFSQGFQNGAMWADNHPKSPWVKSSDKLPTRSGHYLCMKNDSHNVTTLFFNRNKWFNPKTFEDIPLEVVIYWMPIPELPKE